MHTSVRGLTISISCSGHAGSHPPAHVPAHLVHLLCSNVCLQRSTLPFAAAEALPPAPSPDAAGLTGCQQLILLCLDLFLLWSSRQQAQQLVQSCCDVPLAARLPTLGYSQACSTACTSENSTPIMLFRYVHAQQTGGPHRATRCAWRQMQARCQLLCQGLHVCFWERNQTTREHTSGL